MLWRPDDDSDSFYIVINGRLRAITEKDNGKMSVSLEFEASILSDGKRDGKV